MTNSFFTFFSKDRPFIGPDPERWPDTWKREQWKSYPQGRRFLLPSPVLPHKKLGDVLVSRTSRRDFSGEALTTEEISSLLFYSCGAVQREENSKYTKRLYPSGGGRYPIETYPLLVKGTNSLPRNIYHYNVQGHSLEQLSSERKVSDVTNLFHYPWAADSSVVLIFSFIESRSKPKYGNLAYKFGLIEAGHIGQNVYLTSEALGLKCCALGGFRDEERVQELLGLNGMTEVAFYAIAVGR